MTQFNNLADYILKKNSATNELAVSKIRKYFIRGLLLSERNVMDNDTFNHLMEEEQNKILESNERYAIDYEGTGIATLFKMCKKVTGREDIAIGSINLLLNNEFPQYAVPSKLATWLIGNMEENDVSSHESLCNYASDYLIRMALIKKAFNDPSKLEIMQSAIEKSIEEALKLRIQNQFLKDTILSTLILFLFHWKRKEMIEAKYFLMKASQLNYEGYEYEILILFLHNIFIVNEEI